MSAKEFRNGQLLFYGPLPGRDVFAIGNMSEVIQRDLKLAYDDLRKVVGWMDAEKKQRRAETVNIDKGNPALTDPLRKYAAERNEIPFDDLPEIGQLMTKWRAPTSVLSGVGDALEWLTNRTQNMLARCEGIAAHTEDWDQCSNDDYNERTQFAVNDQVQAMSTGLRKLYENVRYVRDYASDVSLGFSRERK